MSDTGQFAAAIIRYAAKSFYAGKSLLSHSCRYTADRQASRRRISRWRTKILFCLA
jgi:hypothetical protein